MQVIAVFFLVSVAIGGVAYVFIYPYLSGERKAEQRMQSVAKTEPLSRATRGPQKSRRDLVETSLKDFDERHKKSKSVPISVRITRAGLTWSKRQFAMISAAIGLGMFSLGVLSGTGLIAAAGLGFAGAFGVPRWLLSYLPEANFFGIVVAIQQKAGGNLSEALGNLSKVLRDRKKMRAKIQAMSQEAKASAAIIGALPIAVMILVYLTAPQYITLLFTNSMGHIMLAGSAVWMTIGVLVMKKMINFDF